MRHIYSLLKRGFLLISRLILAIKLMFLHNNNVFRIILGGMVRMFRYGNLLQFHSFIIEKQPDFLKLKGIWILFFFTGFNFNLGFLNVNRKYSHYRLIAHPRCPTIKNHARQFSTHKPDTRLNSCKLSVTKIAFKDEAWADIKKSL